MNDILEYGDEIPEDDVLDEEDRLRMEIMAAEADEVWLEEDADEDDEATVPPMNPLFGMLSAAGGVFPRPSGPEMEDEEKNEDPES